MLAAAAVRDPRAGVRAAPGARGDAVSAPLPPPAPPVKPCRTSACPPTCALGRWCEARGVDGRLAHAFFPVWRSELFSRGNILFHPGNLPAALFFLCTGRVRLWRCEGGARRTVRIASAPDFVGVRELIAGTPYASTAEVMEETEVCMIEAGRFRTLWTRKPELARVLSRELAAKLARAEERVSDLALRTISERAAKHLVRLSEEAGGSAEVELGESRGELADLLGTSATVLCRALTALTRRGLIRVQGRRVVIRDARRLRAASHLPPRP